MKSNRFPNPPENSTRCQSNDVLSPLFGGFLARITNFVIKQIDHLMPSDSLSVKTNSRQASPTISTAEMAKFYDQLRNDRSFVTCRMCLTRLNDANRLSSRLIRNCWGITIPDARCTNAWNHTKTSKAENKNRFFFYFGTFFVAFFCDVFRELNELK